MSGRVSIYSNSDSMPTVPLNYPVFFIGFDRNPNSVHEYSKCKDQTLEFSIGQKPQVIEKSATGISIILVV